MKKGSKIVGVGLVTAIASSLCCITPLLALISGTSGIASSFSWLEPYRPYLVGITILVLVFAWYLKLKPKKEIDCDCETDKKPSFLQSKLFLAIVTTVAIIMTAFPYYASVFYPKNEKELVVVNNKTIRSVTLEISGMTCASCEKHINYTVNLLEGVLTVESSYENGTAAIKFDPAKTTLNEIEKAINSTGYSVMPTNEK